MSEESSLGHRIKEARKEYSLTLKELGEKVGVTHAFLSRIENNKVKPSDELLQKIAHALDYNDSQDYLNEFRLLAGTYNDIEKGSKFYNSLKSSGRLEIPRYNIKDTKEDKIVERPFYKLNYLFESDFKIFYDIKTTLLGEKVATIEIPNDVINQLYKDINRRIIECVKQNPELLKSIEQPDVIDEYKDKRRKRTSEMYDYLNLIDTNENAEEFMREIFDDENLI